MDHPFTYDPNQPPRTIRFEAIGDAWKIIWSDIGTWVLTSLILFGVAIALEIPIFLIFFRDVSSIGARVGSSRGGPFDFPFQSFGAFFVGYVVLLIAFSILGGLWMTGTMRLALLRVRGSDVPVGELFNLDGMGGQVILYHLLVSLAGLILVGINFGIFFGIAAVAMNSAPVLGIASLAVGYIIALIFSILFQSVLLFGPLMIVDQKLPAIDAARLSIKTIWPHVLPAFGVHLCAGILGVLGELACCVGILVTMPLPYVTTAVMYNDFFRLPSPEPQQRETLQW